MNVPPPTHVSAGAEASTALRNASSVVAQRVFQIAIGVVFALLIPRLMGPEVFGQYALVTSISLWFALLSGLGAASMMTRSVPEFVMRGDGAGLRKFVSSLLVLRLATGVVAGVLYLALTMFWLRDFDVVALAFMAGAVLCRTTANICFALFLGLNQAGRWAMGDVLRRALMLVFVLIGFNVAGLRGACAAWFAAEVVVLVVGVWMSREHICWSAMWPDRQFLLPYLRTGAYFAGGNMLLAVSQRTGESLVHLTTRSFAEVGYYGVAYGMYAAGTQALWHTAAAFAPMLILWNARGEVAAAREWLERLQAWLTVGAVTGVIVVLLAGDLVVARLLGPEYLPASRNLAPLAIAFVSVAFSSVGRLQALVVDLPGVSAKAAGVELVTFWTTGLVLATGAGSFGACLAVLAGATVNAAYLAWRLRGEHTYSHRPAVHAGLLALPVLPLAWFHASWPIELLLLAVAVAGYAALVLGTRVVTVGELAALRRSLRMRTR
ncbi:MAG: oligosaccharide flippase family protein, partial [Vicinamibacterales bacterium]